jgi:hypothetical protein
MAVSTEGPAGSCSRNDTWLSSQDAVPTISNHQSPKTIGLAWSPGLPVSSVSNADAALSKEILHHFSTMTARTVGDTRSQIITQSRVIQSALHSPYLMHAVLGLAAAHLRYLIPAEAAAASNMRLKIAECYHWGKALEGFRLELAGPPVPDKKVGKHRSHVTQHNMDQLLSTVMFVSMHQFSLRDDAGAITDQQAAPCSFVWLEDRSARDHALKWLGIQAGFKGLLPAMQPWLNESFWLPIFGAVDFSNEFSLDELSDIALDPEYDVGANIIDPVEFHFIKLCRIDRHSKGQNPYYASLEILLWCRRLRPISAETFTKLLNFVARMHHDFQDLLLDRDPAALLILAHWLALMLEIGQWWITGRCIVEIRELFCFVSQSREGPGLFHHVQALLRELALALEPQRLSLVWQSHHKSMTRSMTRTLPT